MLLSQRFRNDGKPMIEMTDSQIRARDAVIEKIRSGYYSEHDMECDCGNDNDGYEIIAEKDRYGIPQKICICKKCGLILSKHTLDQQSLNRFYDEDYRSLYVPNGRPNEDFFNEQYEHGKQIGAYLSHYLDLSKSNILEIGTGAGGIIKAIQDLYGSSVTGIDLGKEYLDFGRQYDIRLYQESTEDHAKRETKYDVIILSHVIEHFLNLENEMRVISSLLNEGGCLYVEVPGIKNTYATYGTFIRSIQNAHVRYFSKDVLRQILQNYGYTMMDGDEYIHSVFRISDEKDGNGSFHNYSDEILEYLKRNEKKYLWYVRIKPLCRRVKERLKSMSL